MNRPLAPLALVLALACANPALAAEDISRINGTKNDTRTGKRGISGNTHAGSSLLT